MAKKCQVTYKKPMQGNNVSHSNRKTRRRFMPNLQNHRFWINNKNRYIKLRISTKGMRILDKYGIEKILNKKKDYIG